MQVSTKFSLFRVFTSHLVLQRQKPIVLSGKAESGKAVAVTFAGQRQNAVADRPDRNDTTLRNAQLKEPYLARALHSCEPENIQGRQTLSEYANSMQACYALFARQQESEK